MPMARMFHLRNQWHLSHRHNTLPRDGRLLRKNTNRMEYSNLLREWNWAVFMPKSIKSSSRSKAAAAKSDSGVLKGWQKIATFLGQHVTVVQRWAKTGTPVTRQSRIVTAVPS
jgi:hypothetical protein